MNKINIIVFSILCSNSTFYGMKRHLERVELPSQTSSSTKKVKRSTQDENLLHTTVKMGDLESTKQLLNNGGDINSIHMGATALKIAIQKQHIAMIDFLLRYNPQNKCFPEVFKTNNTVIIQRYFTNPHITQADLDLGYRQALNAIKLSLDTPETTPYKSAAELFIEHYNSLLQEKIVTTAGIRSPVLR